jgi:hypothetical protein
VTDAVLIRAPLGIVYRTLTDLDGWPGWLDGCRSLRHGSTGVIAHDGPTQDGDPASPSDRHDLVLPGARRPLRLDVVVHGWRHDVGMRWEVRWLDPRRPLPSRWSREAVTTEWWLEERREGVVLRHVLHDVPRAGVAVRTLVRHRHSVVLAMQAMKDHLELAVAHAAGRVP